MKEKLLFLIMLLFVFVVGCSTQQTSTSQMVIVDINTLLQNPAEYLGKIIETNAIVGDHVWVGSATGNVESSLFLVKSLSDAEKIKKYTSNFDPTSIALVMFKDGKPMTCTDYSGFGGTEPHTECSHDINRGEKYKIKGIIKALESGSAYGEYQIDVINWS